MTAFLNLLARLPRSLVAAFFVASGVLVIIHDRLLTGSPRAQAEQFPQWAGYLSVKLYWLLLPLAVLALWSRRRGDQGRLGWLAGWLNVVAGPLQYTVLTGAALVWGALMGRGDLPDPFIAVEFLTLLGIPGGVLAGVAMLRDPGTSRVQAILVGILLPVAWLHPFGALVVGGCLAVVLLSRTAPPASLDTASTVAGR